MPNLAVSILGLIQSPGLIGPDPKIRRPDLHVQPFVEHDQVICDQAESVLDECQGGGRFSRAGRAEDSNPGASTFDHAAVQAFTASQGKKQGPSEPQWRIDVGQVVKINDNFVR
jgi:hypothetical protein